MTIYIFKLHFNLTILIFYTCFPSACCYASFLLILIFVVKSFVCLGCWLRKHILLYLAYMETKVLQGAWLTELPEHLKKQIVDWDFRIESYSHTAKPSGQGDDTSSLIRKPFCNVKHNCCRLQKCATTTIIWNPCGQSLKNHHQKITLQEQGTKIGRSRIHCPLLMGETLSWSSEEQSEQPTVSQNIWRSETKNRGHWKDGKESASGQ